MTPPASVAAAVQPATPGVIAVNWFWHRRTTSLCEYLDVPLFTLASKRRGLLRYVHLAAATFGLVNRERPAVVVVQNPSMIATACLVLLRPLYRFRVVVDAHNEAVDPYLHTSAPMRWLARQLLRRPDLVVVTNAQLAARVDSAGGSSCVLPDRLPQPLAAVGAAPTEFRVVVVATYERDEPIAAVLAAAARLPDVQFVMTGRAEKFQQAFGLPLPGNVRLSGFLPEAEYQQLLRTASAVMDLTSMPDCMVCGAYEAIAAGTPVVLSGNRASRDWFAGLGEFTSNEPDDIARAITALRAAEASLRREFAARRAALEERWRIQAAVLRGRLVALANGAREGRRVDDAAP